MPRGFGGRDGGPRLLGAIIQQQTIPSPISGEGEISSKQIKTLISGGGLWRRSNHQYYGYDE